MRTLGLPCAGGSVGLHRGSTPLPLAPAGQATSRARPGALRVHAAAAEVAKPEEMSEEKRDIQKMLSKPYKYGFKTIIESDVFPKGLSEDVVRAISAKKDEPEWLLDFR